MRLPYQFKPTTEQHGVGSHPHRGFETVTLAYQGEVTHQDSAGGGGTIQAGDVQWMTAGAGLVHEEFHSAHSRKRVACLKWCNCGSICLLKTK